MDDPTRPIDPGPDHYDPFAPPTGAPPSAGAELDIPPRGDMIILPPPSNTHPSRPAPSFPPSPAPPRVDRGLPYIGPLDGCGDGLF